MTDYLIDRGGDDVPFSEYCNGQGIRMDLSNALTFNQWMHKVDAWLMSHFGVTHHDIADYAYMDCYRDGMDPEDAAREAVDYDGSIGVFLIEELL